MKSTRLKLDGVDWEQADSLFRRLSDGLLRSSNLMRPAVIWAFRRASISKLRTLSVNACLPFEKKVETQPSGRTAETQPQVLLAAALSSLVDPSFSAVRFSVWQSIFNELYRVHRWVQRQSAQSRLQAFFLMGFVPFVAVILGLFNFSTLLANLAEARGRTVFFVALVFYLVGFFWVSRLVQSGKGLFSNLDLSVVQGRLGFLNEILCASATARTRIGRLSAACSRSRQKDVNHFGRSLSVGLSGPEGQLGIPNSLREGDLAMLSNLKRGYIYRPQGAQSWLMGRYRAAFEEFQDESARSAALLSMRLLLPMAIFFLPALFLFLALCGFSLTPDTLN
jgi:hypothetical protein